MAENLPTKCKICGEHFLSNDALNKHLRSFHSIKQVEYYPTYHPRFDLLTRETIPFKNIDSYFKQNFIEKKNLNQYCWDRPKYCSDILIEYSREKNTNFAPSFFEFRTSDRFPTVSVVKKHYESYGRLCLLSGLKLKYPEKLIKEFWNELDVSNQEIIIDTREQKPLKFKNSISKKLDYGDYALNNPESKTFVERKSLDDFRGTMTSGYDRFIREIERCKSNGHFLFIVVDSSIDAAKKAEYVRSFNKQASIKHVFKKARDLIIDYHDCVQIIFSGGRTNSVDLIHRIFYFDYLIWNVDLLYFVEEHYELGTWKARKKTV